MEITENLLLEIATSGSGINNESSLHGDLKKWYKLPGDTFEARLEGYVVDILRDNDIIEIQTKNFSAIANKLRVLLVNHKLTLVHPIAVKKWLLKYDKDYNLISKRKSPKTGKAVDIFKELIRIPDLLSIPNLSIHILLIEEEDILMDDGLGSWHRKGFSIKDKKLLSVMSNIFIPNLKALIAIIPFDFEGIFSSKEIAQCLKVNQNLARKIIYTLRKSNYIESVGKKGNLILYSKICMSNMEDSLGQS